MVALRKESVDRNHVRDTTSTRPRVALRKESVDRNWGTSITLSIIVMSLSARRAWIEIRIYDMSAAWNRRSPQGERG